MKGLTMTRLATLLALLALLVAAGCGDDDEEGGRETTTPETEAATGPFKDCVEEAGLELVPEGTEYTDDKGESKTREKLDMENTTYLGFVQWPSKRVADVYEGDDEAAAEKAEQDAGSFVKAFGFDPAKYVSREGTTVLVFDDPPPSDDEVGQLTACAG
jgi:hypothetical protein